jgi:hypothetical protein
MDHKMETRIQKKKHNDHDRGTATGAKIDTQVLSLFIWLVADDWFVLREKYCCLVADKPSERCVRERGRGGGLTATTTCNACRIREIDFSWLLEVAFSVVGVGLTALLAVGGKSVGAINADFSKVEGLLDYLGPFSLN